MIVPSYTTAYQLNSLTLSMVNYGFVLLPLYIYPTPGAWEPLFSNATANPDVTFYAVVNPANGPGAGACPDANFVDAMGTLNTIPNIKTLAYVHTAYQYDCGSSGTDICTCSAPLNELEANITKYQQWPSACCSSGGTNANDIHIDGIFIEESPSNSTCLDYMRSATSFARDILTQGNTVLFNAGASVDSAYWSVADYINVFENTEAVYDAADINALNGNGKFLQNSTLIIYGYTDGAEVLQRDVNTILSVQNDAIAGLYITDQNGYSAFPGNFATFVSDVAAVVKANMGS